MSAPSDTAIDLREIEQFLFREARYADEGAYDEWEALWTDDGSYWVPAASDHDDSKISILHDNRSRIGVRIAQLKTGKRHSQTPPSSVRRLLSNVEVLDAVGDEVSVAANFIAIEARNGQNRIWGGRVEYQLRRVDGDLRMARKKVLLVDRDQALPTMAFLI